MPHALIDISTRLRVGSQGNATNQSTPATASLEFTRIACSVDAVVYLRAEYRVFTLRSHRIPRRRLVPGQRHGAANDCACTRDGSGKGVTSLPSLLTPVPAAFAHLAIIKAVSPRLPASVRQHVPPILLPLKFRNCRRCAHALKQFEIQRETPVQRICREPHMPTGVQNRLTSTCRPHITFRLPGGPRGFTSFRCGGSMISMSGSVWPVLRPDQRAPSKRVNKTLMPRLGRRIAWLMRRMRSASRYHSVV
jgi:hypothetical protein